VGSDTVLSLDHLAEGVEGGGLTWPAITGPSMSGASASGWSAARREHRPEASAEALSTHYAPSLTRCAMRATLPAMPTLRKRWHRLRQEPAGWQSSMTSDGEQARHRSPSGRRRRLDRARVSTRLTHSLRLRVTQWGHRPLTPISMSTRAASPVRGWVVSREDNVQPSLLSLINHPLADAGEAKRKKRRLAARKAPSYQRRLAKRAEARAESAGSGK
jgi:hypothetical protein